MKKSLQQKSVFLLVPVLFLMAFSNFGISFQRMVSGGALISSVHAEDDENEREDDGERSPSLGTSTALTQETIKVEKVKPVYKTVLVPVVTITLDPIFTIDTDKDGIVDGLDPHPTVPESEYFTDDDNDGIANAFDMHKEEDDFAYYEQDNDTNGNGILDSFESLGGI